MKLMKPEQLVQYFVLCVFFSLFLSACTDAATPVVLQETEAGAELPDNLPVCTWEHEGEVSLLPNDNQTYRCEGGDWHPYNVYNGMEAGNETEWSSFSNNENLWDDYSFASSSSVMILISSSDVVSSSSVQTILRISSSSVKSSSSEDVIQGPFVDSRDGKTYKVTTIGSQVWMAENLNYDTAGGSCYGGLSSNCAQYGRLYTWEAAKKVCPTGWHLPSASEFEALINTVGGETEAGGKLKSTSSWFTGSGGVDVPGNGSDVYSFSALPAGYGTTGGIYYDNGHNANFWSSSESAYIDNTAIYMRINYYNDYAHLGDEFMVYRMSVRCIRN